MECERDLWVFFPRDRVLFYCMKLETLVEPTFYRIKKTKQKFEHKLFLNKK